MGGGMVGVVGWGGGEDDVGLVVGGRGRRESGVDDGWFVFDGFYGGAMEDGTTSFWGILYSG